jgi:hypothetical protein
MKPNEKYLMLVTFSIAFLGIIGLATQIISVLLWLSAGVYLFLGWILLSPSKNGKIQLIPFLVSYLIAQTIVAVLFGIHNYPMETEFSYITSSLLLIAIILILIYKKTLIIEYPINKYLIILIICIMFSLAPLWMEILQ